VRTEDYNALVRRKPSLLASIGLDVEPKEKVKTKPVRESEIHKQISQECHRRGLLAFHGAMHKKSARTPGEPDYTVLLPGGKVLLVEVKTSNGNLSEAQERVAGHAWQLGHTVHVVRRFEEFHDLVRKFEP
jgi:hypothetical protein